jgi:hypothetical protein
MKFYKKTIINREDGKPYLIRHSLFSCAWFAIKVHNILLSDPSCQHDHPWAFITFLMKGSYIEESYFEGWKRDRYVIHAKRKHYKRFSLLFRSAKYTHRLIVGKPVWTFVVTFKKVRTWGFVTPSGWVEWFKYKDTNHCD